MKNVNIATNPIAIRAESVDQGSQLSKSGSTNANAAIIVELKNIVASNRIAR